MNAAVTMMPARDRERSGVVQGKDGMSKRHVVTNEAPGKTTPVRR